jgi:hypothetical protein
MGRIAKQALAFIIGLGIVGGLVYWSMASSLNELKSAKANQTIMEIHSTDMLCATYDTTEKCTKTFEVKSTGSYTDLKGVKQKLTPEQVTALKKLIREADFSILQPGEGTYCHANNDMPQISYSFNTIDDPTWYVPCTSTNARSLPLFNFIEQELKLPLDTKA